VAAQQRHHDSAKAREVSGRAHEESSAGGLITGVDIGDSKVVENAMIAGPATGSPTIHVLNVTASAIESVTMSWWCSSIGDLGETACNRRSVCSHVYHCGQLPNDPESSSALSPLHDAVC